jgi:hypothetical protein
MKLREFLLPQELIGLTGGQLRLPGEGNHGEGALSRVSNGST